MIIGWNESDISAQVSGQIIMAAVYFINYFLLMPVFFIDKNIKSKTIWFILFNLTFTALYISFIMFRGIIFFKSGKIDSPLDHAWDLHINYVYIILGSTGFRMAVHWNTTNDEIRKIEEDKFRNEAKQIINKETTNFIHRNIPELIRLAEYKPELLKKAIISFSELLRYSLYQKNSVPLSKELRMLTEYEKLCLLLSESFSLTIRTHGDTKNVTVMPTHLIYKLQECINKTSDKPEGKYLMEIFSDSNEIKSVIISPVIEKRTENILIQ
jgi:hypothetical protein